MLCVIRDLGANTGKMVTIPREFVFQMLGMAFQHATALSEGGRALGAKLGIAADIGQRHGRGLQS